MINTVIFDLDNTLYDYNLLHPKAMLRLKQYVCTRFHVESKAFEEAFDSARRETKETLANTAASHNRLLYCQKTLEHLRLPPTEDALEMYDVYWDYFMQNMELRPGAEELLRYCEEHQIKVGICSDLTAHIQYRKLQALRIESAIDALVTSEEAGVEKPNPRMFNMILDKLNSRSEDSLFVGDDLERDILGAEGVGMAAMWLGGHDRENAIASLEDVKKRLENESK